MKIILMGRYNPTEVLTGPEKFSKRLYENLNRLGLECEFIEYFFDGKRYSIMKKLFGKEIFNHNNNRVYRLGIFRIVLFLISSRPKIIHLVSFERYHAIIFIIKKLLSISVVYTVHGITKYENIEKEKSSYDFTNIKDLLYEFILYKYSDSIIFLSDISKDLALNYYKVDEKKIQKIYHGADNIFYEVGKQKKNNNKTIRAVFVGDYNRKEKGLFILLRSLWSININLELHVISNNNFVYDMYNHHLKVYIYSKFNTYNYANFLKDKEIFISASKYETFSIAALEGIVSGLVPFFTYETGLSEITQKYNCGYYFFYDDIENIKKYILDYVAKRKQHISQYVYLRKHLKLFNWDEVVKQYYNLYRALNQVQ